MGIADGDILRVTAKMLIGEDDVQNVYHLEVSLSGTPSDEQVTSDIVDQIEYAMSPLVSSIADTVDFSTVEVWNLTQDALVGVEAFSSLTVGGNGTSQMPPQTAALVLFNTAVARSQGRKFLPPFGVSSQDPDGSVIAASLTNIITYANRILEEVTGTGWVGEFGNWNPVLVRFAEYISVQVRDLFATQRRRYVGSGS